MHKESFYLIVVWMEKEKGRLNYGSKVGDLMICPTFPRFGFYFNSLIFKFIHDLILLLLYSSRVNKQALSRYTRYQLL